MEKQVKLKLDSFDAICYVVKALALFFCFYPLFDLFFSFSPTQSLMEINLGSMITAVGLLLMVLAIWLVFQTNSDAKLWRRILEIFIFFAVCCASVMTSGGSQSHYKFLFIFIVVTYTLQYRTSYGMWVAGLSAAALFGVDIAWANIYSRPADIQSDIALSIMFIIVAFIIGRYAEQDARHIRELTELINIDGLTGLYNHRYFHDTLRSRWETCHADGTPLSLILLDIDYFKQYNEVCGHQEGDKAIRSVAQALLERVPEGGVACRYGGEEFALIVPGMDAEAAAALAETLRVAILLLPIPGERALPGRHLTVSLGVSHIREDDNGYDSMINRAANALFRAKYLRKNSVETYRDTFDRFPGMDDSTYGALLAIQGLVNIINTRDNYTYSHTERVATCCEMVAHHMKLSEDDMRTLVLAAYMHDVGKIEVEKETLIADRRLNDEEWVAIRRHPAVGCSMLEQITGMEDVAKIVGQHHERYDGTGYPAGLPGSEIHPLAAILSVADAFDAMTNNRPYQRRRSYEEALAEIRRVSGTQFDPFAVAQFTDTIEQELAKRSNGILEYFPEEKTGILQPQTEEDA